MGGRGLVIEVNKILCSFQVGLGSVCSGGDAHRDCCHGRVGATPTSYTSCSVEIHVTVVK